MAGAYPQAVSRQGPPPAGAGAREQGLLGRLVDIGTELFASSTACSWAQHLLATGDDRDSLLPVVDLFWQDAW